MLSHNFVTIFPVHIQLSLVSQCAVWTGMLYAVRVAEVQMCAAVRLHTGISWLQTVAFPSLPGF